MRPPDLPGGNRQRHARLRARVVHASMRPPDLPGGNLRSSKAFSMMMNGLQ